MPFESTPRGAVLCITEAMSRCIQLADGATNSFRNAAAVPDPAWPDVFAFAMSAHSLLIQSEFSQQRGPARTFINSK